MAGKPAKFDARLLRVGDYIFDVPIPNPALQEWLNSEDARKAIGRVVHEIRIAYTNYLPERTGALRAGTDAWVGRRTYPGQTERFYGWVGNRALSYRKRRGQPYPRFIEYGKANVAPNPGYRRIKTKAGWRTMGPDGRWAKREVAYHRTGTRTGGGYQLHNAALLVARQRGEVMEAAALSYLTGGGTFNPAHHTVRPAQPHVDRLERMRQLAKGDRSMAERAAETRRRDQINRERAARSRANMRNAPRTALSNKEFNKANPDWNKEKKAHRNRPESKSQFE